MPTIFEPRSYTAGPRKPDKPFVMMYHESLVERNRVNLAVEALAMVRDSVSNAELHIYGRETPFLERVMEQVRQKNLSDRVRYLGRKTLEQLVGEIQKCDVGVIPNQSNAFTDINTPTRIFEYLALGKPVIATYWSGNVDFMDETCAACIDFEIRPLGRKYGPYDADQQWAEPSIESASRWMRTLYENRATGRRLAAAGRKKIRQALSAHAVGKLVRERLEQINH